VQRYGADLPETVLDFDSGRRAVLLGAEKSAADANRIAESILDYLGGIDGPAKEAEINEAVEGSTKLQRAALRELFEAGKVLREGSGRKGDPYLYSTAGKCSFSCSQDISGARKQESKNVAYPAETKRKFLFRRFQRNRVNRQNPSSKNFASQNRSRWSYDRSGSHCRSTAGGDHPGRRRKSEAAIPGTGTSAPTVEAAIEILRANREAALKALTKKESAEAEGVPWAEWKAAALNRLFL
jgi:hypothetical protein